MHLGASWRGRAAVGAMKIAAMRAVAAPVLGKRVVARHHFGRGRHNGLGVCLKAGALAKLGSHWLHSADAWHIDTVQKPRDMW